MWLKDLWRRWLDRPAAGRRAWPAPRGNRPRLSVEPLEGRAVPASFTAGSVSDLRADINAANLAGGSNTITLLASTTFTLVEANNFADGATGLPVIAANDNLTIVGNADIIQRSTAKGTPAFRLFDVAAGAALALKNLTLQGGLAFGRGGAAEGGAIYNQGTLNLSSVTVQNNQAVGDSVPFSDEYGYGTLGEPAYGGGLYAAGGTVTLRNTIVTNNTAKGGTTHETYYPTEYGNHRSQYSNQEPGYGGGLYIAPAALAYLDAFTVVHITKNHADVDPNISGSYALVP